MTLKKINTKVIFEWNKFQGQYEEIYCESYDYSGEVAYCQDAGTNVSISGLQSIDDGASSSVNAAAFPSPAILVAADEEIPR